MTIALLLLCACGGDLASDDAAGPDGASDGTTPGDGGVSSIPDVVLPDGFDANNCSGDLGFSSPCTPEIEAICETRARDQAYGAYGHSICQDATGLDSACTRGDYCLNGPDGSTPCRCSPTLICAPGYVCYSDTPDGATHCKVACTPSP